MRSRLRPKCWNACAGALRKALELLQVARVCRRIQVSDARGVPLRAEVRDRVFEVLLVGRGLASASLGLSLEHVKTPDDVMLVNEAALAEQVVGQARPDP